MMRHSAVQERTPVISRESLLLIGICLVDAFLTIALVSYGLATEGNPILHYCLDRGVAAFYFVKLFPLIPLVWLAESYRRRNPQFVQTALRIGIAAYLGFYAISVISLNCG